MKTTLIIFLNLYLLIKEDVDKSNPNLLELLASFYVFSRKSKLIQSFWILVLLEQSGFYYLIMMLMNKQRDQINSLPIPGIQQNQKVINGH